MTKLKEDEKDTVKVMQKKGEKWSIAYRLNLWTNKSSLWIFNYYYTIYSILHWLQKLNLNMWASFIILNINI